MSEELYLNESMGSGQLSRFSNVKLLLQRAKENSKKLFYLSLSSIANRKATGKGQFKEMSILESQIERAVVKWATARNIQSIKLNLQGRRAYPDRLFWIDGGRPALIEFKKPGKKVTPLQAHTIGLLEEMHYNVLVTDNKKDACKFLENCVPEASRVSKTRG